jgi:adenine deaminase
VGYGFVKGFGIEGGAMAQTVAHDAHNLLVVGSNDEDMALAANTLIECGGGMVAVKDGKVLGLVPLPIAGLMNDEPLGNVCEYVESVEKAWKEMGCSMPSPFMTMALIPLACLPETRLTNRGLVDCRTFNFIDLIIE